MNKIYVIGIGPGELQQMSMKAVKAMEMSDIIIGYKVYVELVKEHFQGKKFLSTPMKREKDRCIQAFEEAIAGKTVSMICSGDSGVYGMGGLMLEISSHYPEIIIEIIPGITAAIAGGSVLGAPLTNDFAVISLSDLLTPWEKIEKRLACAAEADFVICLYNPSSKNRYDYLQKACDIILKYNKEETVCGLVNNIGREGQKMKILSLQELKDTPVDMFTTVFIGNSQTKVINGRMVTPRGYDISVENAGEYTVCSG